MRRLILILANQAGRTGAILAARLNAANVKHRSKHRDTEHPRQGGRVKPPQGEEYHDENSHSIRA